MTPLRDRVPLTSWKINNPPPLQGKTLRTLQTFKESSLTKTPNIIRILILSNKDNYLRMNRYRDYMREKLELRL